MGRTATYFGPEKRARKAKGERPEAACAYCGLPAGEAGHSNMYDLHVTRQQGGAGLLYYVARFGLTVINKGGTVSVPAMTICKGCAKAKGLI